MATTENSPAVLKAHLGKSVCSEQLPIPGNEVCVDLLPKPGNTSP